MTIPKIPAITHEDCIRTILQLIGEDPDREGLKETPDRIFRSYGELYDGYHKDPAKVLKCFKDGTCDEMVVLQDIPFRSMCEHHVLPFFGTACIAYVPNGRVVGISKLPRLLDIFSHRLQMQERITTQVTTALDLYLEPKGSACLLRAQHMCMTLRGVRKHNSILVTSSLTGVFKTDAKTRSEFLGLVRS